MPNDPVQEDLIRRVTLLERRLDNLNLPEKSLLLAAPFLQLPVLRGLWVSTVSGGTAPNAAGDWLDLSGLGKTLGYNGNPTVNHDGKVAYWNYDGAGDYHSRADEADLDIIGTESYVAAAARGLTIGGWFWFDTHNATSEIMMSKWTTGAANDIAYALFESGASNLPYFGVGDGATQKLVNSTDTLTTGQWHFCVGRYTRSTEIALFHNGTKFTNVAGIYAALLNNAADFVIGGLNGGSFLIDGRCAAAFLCAAAASDAMVGSMFQATRALFGV